MPQRALSVTDWPGCQSNGWGFGIVCTSANIIGTCLRIVCTILLETVFASIVNFHVVDQVVSPGIKISTVVKFSKDYQNMFHLSNGWGLDV